MKVKDIDSLSLLDFNKDIFYVPKCPNTCHASPSTKPKYKLIRNLNMLSTDENYSGDRKTYFLSRSDGIEVEVRDRSPLKRLLHIILRNEYNIV